MNATLKKPKLCGKGSFTPPEPKKLTRESEPGDYVYWEVGSDKRTGILVVWKDERAIIDTTPPPVKRIMVELS
jgi:hypothetical protein